MSWEVIIRTQLIVLEFSQDEESEKWFKTSAQFTGRHGEMLKGRHEMYYNRLSKICYTIEYEFELFLKMAFKYVLYLKCTPL